MPRPPFHTVLFDLGGVLVRLGRVSPMQRLAGIDDEAEAWRRWLACPWVREFERGWCGVDEFAAGVVAEWGLAITAEAFLDEFRRWPEGLLYGARELVAATRQQVPVGCLSNTNELHWADWASWGVADMFDVRFLSFEVQRIKPDREMFEHVAEALAVAPQRLLFLDDNLINVEGAREAGLSAYQARGVDEAAIVLRELGVISQPAQ